MNSHEHHIIISSESLLKCVIIREMTAASSITKSRSLTPSRELPVGRSKPSFFAVYILSVLYVVPAKAQLPKGHSSIFSAAFFSFFTSRRNISA